MVPLIRSSSEGKGRLTITVSGPAYLASPGMFKATLEAALEPMLRDFGAALAQRGFQGYRWSPMRDRFNNFVVIGPNSYSAVVINADPRLPYKEYDTRPHPPPYKRGTPLNRWARRHGLNPKYVASLIAERGTTGAKIMETALAEMGPEFEAKLKQLIEAVVNGA